MKGNSDKLSHPPALDHTENLNKFCFYLYFQVHRYVFFLFNKNLGLVFINTCYIHAKRYYQPRQCVRCQTSL